VKRAYQVVDVFTGKALLGNPVAVVLDAEGLDTGNMQRIARWTNLSRRPSCCLRPKLRLISACGYSRLGVSCRSPDIPRLAAPTRRWRPGAFGCTTVGWSSSAAAGWSRSRSRGPDRTVA